MRKIFLAPLLLVILMGYAMPQVEKDQQPGDRAMIARFENASDEPATVSGSSRSRVKVFVANTVDDPLTIIGDLTNLQCFSVNLQLFA